MNHYSIVPDDEKRIVNRSVRYRRQKISAELAKNITFHSVKNCMLVTPGNKVQVLLSRSTGRACYSGLMTCGSVWDCPICSAKISARRSEDIKAGSDNWKNQGGAVVMVTYTIRHNLGDSLKSVSKTMTDAIRFVHSGAPYLRIKERFGIRGTISATEILYNPVNGWHYHKHQLLFLDSKDLNSEQLEKWLFNRYNKFLNLNGFDVLPGIGVKVSPPDDTVIPEYLTKWGLEDELTSDSKDSNSLHPFELLDEEKYHARFVEYSRAMYGKRRLTWSKGLRDLLGLNVELTDEQIAEKTEIESDDLIELAIIENKIWRYIVNNNLRADVLEHAERGSDHFQDWYYHRILKRFYLKL